MAGVTRSVLRMRAKLRGGCLAVREVSHAGERRGFMARFQTEALLTSGFAPNRRTLRERAEWRLYHNSALNYHRGRR